jgi:copper chaperone CopZ
LVVLLLFEDCLNGLQAEERMAEDSQKQMSNSSVAPPSSSSLSSGRVQGDHFVLIRIEGMHCHRCEQAIKKNVQRRQGVHEVEVDFASGQASVLFDPQIVAVHDLVEAVRDAGYKATGFTQSHADPASAS